MTTSVNGTGPPAAVGPDLLGLGELVVGGPPLAQMATITPRVAATVLAAWAYPRQRGLRSMHVAALAEAMAGGTFLATPITVAWCAETGQMYLCDGQHRLSAIVRSGLPAELLVIAYALGTFAEVADLYGRLDRGANRTMNDVLRAHAVAESIGVPPSTLQRLHAALPVIAAGFSPTSLAQSGTPLARNGDARVQLAHEWAPELAAYAALTHVGEGGLLGVNKHYGRTIYAAPVAAVALVTLRYAPDRAQAFWSAVVRDDGLRVGTPEKALVNYLTATHVHRTGRSRVAWSVAGAWNAACEGRPLTRVGVRDVSAPIVIAGTPYQGRARASLSAQMPAPVRKRPHFIEVPADPAYATAVVP